MRIAVLLSALGAALSAWEAQGGVPLSWITRVRGGSVEAPLRVVRVSTPPLKKTHLDRKTEVKLPQLATVGQLKDALAQHLKGGPPRSLLRVYFGDQELRDDEAELPEELFEMQRPAVLVDLLLTTSGRDSRTQLFQEVDRISSPEERIEAYAATYSAMRFYLDLFDAPDVAAALDAKGPGLPRADGEDGDVHEADGEVATGDAFHEEAEDADYAEDAEDAPLQFRCNDIAERMASMERFLTAQLQAHRAREEAEASAREQAERVEREDADALAALIRQGSLKGRLKIALAINFNADLRGWGIMMVGMLAFLFLGGVAPHMRPLMYAFIGAAVGFQARPVRFATKVAMNMMPPSMVALAGSFLSAPHAYVLTHDRNKIIEDMYGKEALE